MQCLGHGGISHTEKRTLMEGERARPDHLSIRNPVPDFPPEDEVPGPDSKLRELLVRKPGSPSSGRMY